MSFNVFDEAPENEIVLKEQQAQNKMVPVEYFLWEFLEICIYDVWTNEHELKLHLYKYIVYN